MTIFSRKWTHNQRANLLRWLLVLLMWSMLDTAQSWGQYRDPRAQKSYTDYYRQNWKTTGRPTLSANTYTFNRIYQHNPAISPYLNLLRSPGIGRTNYQTFVQPEIKRRKTKAARANTSYRPGSQTLNQSYRSSPSQTSKYPVRTYKSPSRASYYSHFYGSSRKGR